MRPLPRRQAVEYLKAPVPKSQMGSFITCKHVDWSKYCECGAGGPKLLHAGCSTVLPAVGCAAPAAA